MMSTPSGITKRSNPGIALCEITKGERDPSCECMTCREYRHSLKMVDNGKILYCLAFTYWDGKRWVGDKEYTHAHTIEEARLIFYRSENSRVIRKRNIVGVAPVVGYFVTDKTGQELSV